MSKTNPQVEVISVGNELIYGKISNTNGAIIAQKISQLGGILHRIISIGDNSKSIKNALKDALDASDIVCVTGGLGPTEDDITRETIAKFLKQPLIRSVQVANHIKKIFKEEKLPIPKSNYKQAQIIKGSKVILTPLGTAPAMIIEDLPKYPNKTIILLTGYQTELKLLMAEEIMPYLQGRFNKVVKHFDINTVDTEESYLEKLINDHPPVMDEKSESLAYLPYDLGVRLRITIVGNSTKEVKDRLQILKKQIIKRITPYANLA